MKFNTNSNVYIITYSVVMVVIVAVLLSLAALGLKERQDNNILNEKKTQIVKALGYDLGDIFADTKVIVATDDLVEIKENVDIVEAEHDRILVENEMLKTKNSALTMEIELLKKELQHKEELLALHNYYNKLKPNS